MVLPLITTNGFKHYAPTILRFGRKLRTPALQVGLANNRQRNKPLLEGLSGLS